MIWGSSGFIGSNLADKLQKEGHTVVGVDIEQPKYCNVDIFYQFDLRDSFKMYMLLREAPDELYVLACLMGGMGYIGDEKKHGYDITIGSTEIIINAINYCRLQPSVKKVFYSSSACVYNQYLQTRNDIVALREQDAIPAAPDLLYGWQKLYAEKMFEASGLNYRIARFHNIFGRWGSYDNGKEKAPAALMRKAALANDGDEIEVWGTGEQTRSFLHIDTCLQGIEKLMASDYKEPLNIGSDEMVTINQLAQMCIYVSGKSLTIKNIEGNVGVQGRNSDNTLCEQVLGWKPDTKLIDGIKKTYPWIAEQLNK